MDIDERQKLVEASKLERRNNAEQVPTKFLVFTCVLIPVSVFSGIFLGSHLYLFDLDSYTDSRSAEDLNYSIDGYEIRFVSPEMNDDMEGNWGFTYPFRSDDIFINKNLLDNNNWVQIRKTCEHEKLHNLGLGEDDHDMIEIYEGRLGDPTCETLIDKVS